MVKQISTSIGGRRVIPKGIITARAAFGAAGGLMATQGVPKSLDRVAQGILTKAKKGAPVNTGALRASGRVKRVNQYVRRVQFGGAGTGVDYAQAVHEGTFRQRPQPFLAKAVLASKADIKKIFKDEGNRVLNAVARMGSTR
jgi:HK97 gp10 family phage protein